MPFSPFSEMTVPIFSLMVSEPVRKSKAEIGWQIAKVTSWSLGNGQYGRYVKFTLSVPSEGGDKTDISLVASLKLSPSHGEIQESKLFTIIKAMLGGDLAIGEKVNFNDYIGKLFMVLIANEEDRPFQKVIDVKPLLDEVRANPNKTQVKAKE